MRQKQIAIKLIIALCIIAVFAGALLKKQNDFKAKWDNLLMQGTTYYRTGDNRRAEDCFKELVKMAEKRRDDAVLGSTLNSLGQVYVKQGRYSDAEGSLERAADLIKKAHGAYSYENAIVMRDLANVYRQQGRYHEARKLLVKAMNIAKIARGPNHPKAATFVNDLGLINLSLHNYNEAERLFKESFTRASRVGDYTLAAACLNNLAYTFNLQKDFQKALPLATEAVSQSEKAMGPKHLNTLMARSNLGQALYGLKRYDEAQRVYRGALELSSQALGNRHPQTALLQVCSATIMMRLKDYTKAQQLCEQALRTDEKMLGLLHLETIKARYILVEIYSAQHKNSKAEMLFKKQIKASEEHFGPNSSILAGTLEDYTLWLRKQKRNEEAEEAESRAKMIRKERRLKKLREDNSLPALPSVG